MFEDELLAITTEYLDRLVGFRTSLDTDRDLSEHGKCAKFLIKELKESGFNTKVIRKNGRMSVIGFKGNPDGETFVYNGHYDVVKDSAKWNHFFIRKKKILGRSCYVGKGTNDMKGSISAMLAAIRVSSLKFVEERSMNRRIVIMLVPDEETGGLLGTRNCLNKLVKEGFIKPERTKVLVGEATDLDATTRRRGRYIFRLSLPYREPVHDGPKKIHFRGKSMHSGLFSIHRYKRGELRHPVFDIAHANQANELKGLYHVEAGSYENGKFLPSPTNVVPALAIGYLDKRKVSPDWLNSFMKFSFFLTRTEIKSKPSEYGISISCNRLSFSKNRAKLYIDIRIMNDNRDYICSQMIKIAGRAGIPAKDVSLIAFRNSLYSDGKWPYEIARLAERVLGHPIRRKRENLGQSDSHMFAAYGIPVIEMGTEGGNEHAPKEFVTMRSLVDLAQIYLSLINRYGY
ncbi:MAG: M20/M25/M40 family metallo-hydrolase [Candidatus Micrarchaeota archaeon]